MRMRLKEEMLRDNLERKKEKEKKWKPEYLS